MNTKSKGNIGESVILSKFIKMGIQVSIPFGDNARYDLIADFKGKLNKIQVKYCSQLTENDSIICKTASSLNHTTNKKCVTYQNDVDYIAFYLEPWDICTIIPISEIGNRKTIAFRISVPKNNQGNYWDAKEYSFEKILT